MPPKKKRKYTFRKDKLFPYESGSPMHLEVKAHREVAKRISSAFESPKKRKRKRSLF